MCEEGRRGRMGPPMRFFPILIPFTSSPFRQWLCHAMSLALCGLSFVPVNPLCVVRLMRIVLFGPRLQYFPKLRLYGTKKVGDFAKVLQMYVLITNANITMSRASFSTIQDMLPTYEA